MQIKNSILGQGEEGQRATDVKNAKRGWMDDETLIKLRNSAEFKTNFSKMRSLKFQFFVILKWMKYYEKTYWFVSWLIVNVHLQVPN